MDTTDIAPQETVYVNNLNEKLNKEEMKKSLYAAFSQFGPIIDIVTMKTMKMRGQAFIAYRDVSAATQAVRHMQGFPFYDKPMRLSYAKVKSDSVAKLDGTYQAKDKADRAAKRKVEREEAKAAKKVVVEETGGGKRSRQQQSSSAAGSAAPPKPADAAPKAPPSETPAARSTPSVASPNPILFVENLPDQVNEMMLSMLFQQFPGFKEVRLVPGKSGIAFVEFESETQSSVAQNGLQSFKITPTNLMKISYAKR